MAIYSLPAGCPDLPVYKPLYEAAAAVVQQELGDLELSWQNSSLRSILYLPYLALLHLISNPETRVRSENTVAFTIQEWASAQEHQPTLEQMKQLTEQIRICQCTPMYLSTCLFAWPMLAQCFSAEEVSMASMFACQMQQQSVQFTNELHIMQLSSVSRQHRSWMLPARPASALSTLKQDFLIDLGRLQRLVENVIVCASDEGTPQTRGYRGLFVRWQGRRFAVYMHVSAEPTVAATASSGVAATARRANDPPTPEAAAVTVLEGTGIGAGQQPPGAAEVAVASAGRVAVKCALSVGLDQYKMPKTALGYATYRLLAFPAPAANFADVPEPQIIDSQWKGSYFRGTKCSVFRGFFGIGHFSSYVECERKLRGKGLVLPDGTMKLEFRMRNTLP